MTLYPCSGRRGVRRPSIAGRIDAFREVCGSRPSLMSERAPPRHQGTRLSFSLTRIKVVLKPNAIPFLKPPGPNIAKLHKRPPPPHSSHSSRNPTCCYTSKDLSNNSAHTHTHRMASGSWFEHHANAARRLKLHAAGMQFRHAPTSSALEWFNVSTSATHKTFT